MDENIEVLDEDFIEINNGVDNVIPLDRLFETSNEDIIDSYEEDKILENLKQKKITKIQIGLIVFLIVFASLVYFFGYDFVEPYINADGYSVFENN